MPGLGDLEILRYARHLSLPEIGYEGQVRLKAARVLVIGAGGLGSAVLYYLAAAGIGEITIIDDDRIALDNLQRQILYNTTVIGQAKVDVAADILRGLNPEITINPVRLRAAAENLPPYVAAADIIADTSDNFTTRMAVNGAAMAQDKILVSGAAIGWQGQVSSFSRPTGCYACLFGQELSPNQDNCSTNGVLGPVCGIIGSLQAAEIIKQLLGLTPNLCGTLLSVHGLKLEFVRNRYDSRPECSWCHGYPSSLKLASSTRTL
jgi:molybdopterin-synthase adenylyltransferase